LDCVLLKEKCLNFEKYLKHNNLLDLDGLDLFSELNILKGDYRIGNDKLIDLLNNIKIINYFPNAYIAYKIMLTIPLLVTSYERRFSKLKLIKSLGSTIVSTKIKQTNFVVLLKKIF